MREASGWKMEEPMPTSATAINSELNEPAQASSNSPASVNTMPPTSANGCGLQFQFQCPTSGCKMEAVIWKAQVNKPISEKNESWYDSFTSG